MFERVNRGYLFVERFEESQIQPDFCGQGFIVQRIVSVCERMSNIEPQLCFKPKSEHINQGLKNGGHQWKEEREGSVTGIYSYLPRSSSLMESKIKRIF